MKHDETLEEIWAIRRQIAGEHDFDPKKLGAYYRRRQKAAKVKIYNRKKHLQAAR